MRYILNSLAQFIILPRMAKQLSFFRQSRSTVHGGKPQKGRKLERPLAKKHPIHLVLKSSRAKGSWSFLSFRNRIWIEATLRSKAKKFGVKINDFANIGNHLHLKVRIHNRENFQHFLRALTSVIARKITGARKGNKRGPFWDHLAFTRVLRSWREELYLRGYFMANR